MYNNVAELWTQWKPVVGLALKYKVDRIVERDGTLAVTLIECCDDGKIVVTCVGVIAARSVTELFRYRLISELDKKCGTEFYAAWTFFKVENSRYAEWVRSSQVSNSDVDDGMHFSIVGSNLIVDVLATRDPKIELIKDA